MKYVYLVYEECHGLIGVYGTPESATERVIQEILDSCPELLNEQPFEDMWLIKTTGEFISVDKDDLLSYDAYIEEVK